MVSAGASQHALVDRRRRDVEHHRLHRSRDLRDLRRRRRRRGRRGERRRGHRHHRLRELRRRQRRRDALHAGRRQPAAGVARHGRAAAALREAGRPGGVQASPCATPRRPAAACSNATACSRRISTCFVSHQANRRIILSAAEKLGVPGREGRHQRRAFGNTTAATIPLALNDAVADKRLKRGDLLLMVSVGAGFTVGALLLRWGLKEGSGLRA